LTEEHPLLPSISLIFAMLLWASSFVALKLAFSSYHPMQVIFGRMFIAALCFVGFIPSFRKINWRRQDVKYLLIMGISEPCLYFIFEAKALELTSASQAGMITAMLPLLVAIMAWSWLKESINRTTLAGFSLAIIGSCWLSLASEISMEASCVSGEVPGWLNGAWIYNGPAMFETSVGHPFLHWFDGQAMLHKFTFDNGNVSYINRFIRSRGYLAASEKGKIKYILEFPET